MDQNTHSVNQLLTHPAHLFSGNRDTAVAQVIESLQKTLCSHAGCYTCIVCRQIAQTNHHALLWLTPDGNYTLDDIEKIHTTIRFALDPDQHFFIIIEYAERLNAASANSLLMSLEEPPAGYHFILLVERPEQLLVTIRSRCLIHGQSGMHSPRDSHPLLLFFTQETAPDPLIFIQELESALPSEIETMTLLDTLLAYWHDQHKNALKNNKPSAAKHAHAMLAIITKALEHPPMPGSSKVFWKNLMLALRYQ